MSWRPLLIFILLVIAYLRFPVTTRSAPFFLYDLLMSHQENVEQYAVLCPAFISRFSINLSIIMWKLIQKTLFDSEVSELIRNLYFIAELISFGVCS